MKTENWESWSLEELIDEMKKNILEIPGPIINDIKRRYKMTKAIMAAELFLEGDERSVFLELNFWWHTPLEEKGFIQDKNGFMEEIENAFIKEEWYVFEKVNKPYSPELKTLGHLHLQRLVLKKRLRLVKKEYEAEKNK